MDILRFENPEYFYTLATVPILWILLLLYYIAKKNNLKKFGKHDLVLKLKPQSSPNKYIYKTIVLSLAFIFLSFALVNPQTGSKLETVKRKGVDLLIAVDVSNSMKAEDIQPNRLERSKMAILKLIDELKGDRIGINIFAGKSYPLLPITTDYQAAKMFISNISTDYVKSQGTNMASAIELGMRTFDVEEDEKEVKNNKAIIIITDGEDHEPGAVEMAKEAKKKGIKVYTIGMGSKSGAPIPIYKHGIRTDYKKDNNGNTIITKLNEQNLKNIADNGDGIYIRANNTNAGLKKIFNEINSMNKQEIEAKVFKDYTDRFYIFLILAFIFFIIDIFIIEKKTNLLKFFNS